jgi:uncharacterized phiE125 gp8 family phage protein
MVELEIVGAAPVPCVTVAEAKQHLRVEITDDDTLIAALIDAAQGHVEEVLAWQALTPRDYAASWDTWNGSEVWLPMPPVSEVTGVSIVDDEEGIVTVIDLDFVALDKGLGRIRLYGSAADPGAAGRLHVEYTAGYATAPGWARAAVLLLVGHLYENREGVVVGAGVSAIEAPLGVVALAEAHKAWRPGGAI